MREVLGGSHLVELVGHCGTELADGCGHRGGEDVAKLVSELTPWMSRGK